MRQPVRSHREHARRNALIHLNEANGICSSYRIYAVLLFKTRPIQHVRSSSSLTVVLRSKQSKASTMLSHQDLSSKTCTGSPTTNCSGLCRSNKKDPRSTPTIKSGLRLDSTRLDSSPEAPTTSPTRATPTIGGTTSSAHRNQSKRPDHLPHVLLLL